PPVVGAPFFQRLHAFEVVTVVSAESTVFIGELFEAVFAAVQADEIEKQPGGFHQRLIGLQGGVRRSGEKTTESRIRLPAKTRSLDASTPDELEAVGRRQQSVAHHDFASTWNI